MSKIYLVGTPIGNLQDITLRALDTLRRVDVIACEDTRQTQKLLQQFELKKKLIAYHKDNEKNSAQGILNLVLNQNLSVALVSDAGMPLISDPGFELIKQAREQNVPVEIIPGVSACVTALALSGFAATFTFWGFPKEKSEARLKQIQALDTQHAHIFYVAPHKLMKFLSELDQVWGAEAEVFLAKELTKVFETHFCGAAKNILLELAQRETIKGEFTLVVKLNVPKRTKVNKYEQFSKNQTQKN
ncbi:16S rRNA (cytidine(1402)-2'-O)-methyltransferase [Mycoplasmopsis columbinasalis]|uniref:Ribosomal RNA small subunit methyltransferase I n=1 Tax=Mycoplasmopsis columbinasalis TaxID=114880 RepID=A0A449BB31_9BACT|nr:16S rRNA (cytidine(1402)-2'-O)-methyltransferase [Mycoplasmopsis columbinasalis]VEU78409.1 putative SAM-dependent methyltransferase [Mycoplasmopsis columbinasalis]